MTFKTLFAEVNTSNQAELYGLNPNADATVRENRLRRAQIAAALRLKLPKPLVPDSRVARFRQTVVPNTISSKKVLVAGSEYWITRMNSSCEANETATDKSGADLVWVEKRVQPTRRLHTPRTEIIGRTWGPEDFTTEWGTSPAKLESTYDQPEHKIALLGLQAIINMILAQSEAKAVAVSEVQAVLQVAS